MGVVIEQMESYFEYQTTLPHDEIPRQVLSLAKKSILPLLSKGNSKNISHLIVTTTCPDMLAPSLSQMLIEEFHTDFSKCHAIDLVQGCAGGVSALILGSQLAQLNKSSVIVLQADAAKKATSKSKPIHQIFGNGSFACLLSYDKSPKGLMHFKSQQYKGLSEVVTIKLGHDADEVIKKCNGDVAHDSRKYLGLSMNNSLAIRLLLNAEKFYLEFVKESCAPDIMILHQVNPEIMKRLRVIFAKYNVDFVDNSLITGNCGAASIGIALHQASSSIKEKKILLCGFGTGGVITAGLWQN
jgi:3-oxoacyl-[acyl-carrier-protein] synthase III